MSASITSRIAAGLLLVVLLAPFTLFPAMQAPADGSKPGARVDPLAALNDTSRAAYRSAREDALRRCGPVLILKHDVLVLRYGIHRTEASVVPDRYHTLKAVAHVPLALYALLESVADTDLDAARLFNLRHYRDQVQKAKATLGERGLDRGQLERQNRILDESLEFLANVLRRQRVGGKELTGFTSRLRPLLDDNTRDAARLQIKALHQRVRAWRADLTEEEWKRVKVIVLGSQMPRKDNLAVQYFARLLGEPGEGRRILYAEGLGDEQRALDLLGTHLIDTRIGSAFFDDPKRMHRDLLGDAAKKILDDLFAESKP
jgi:hypothetical protein